jgi:diaminopimelate decarboxylase
MAAFPANGDKGVCHCYAVKANPLAGVMQEMIKGGCGGECASINEVEHCLRQGIPANRVIFDSPCKTSKELKRCFEGGILVNLDNMEEIEKVAGILDEMEKTDADIKSKVRIGLRINPQVGGGSIASTSTATATSKFGVGTPTSLARWW